MSDLTVLIVEDEWLLAMPAEDIVTAEGYRVVGVAAEAAEAFEMAESCRPGLALVDMNLRDGLTGPQMGTALAGLYKIPVIFVTGNPELAPSGDARFCGIVVKPYTNHELAAAVRRVARSNQDETA